VRNHAPAAFGPVYLSTGDASEAKDAAGEACVKASRPRGSFQSGPPFRLGLRAVVENEAKNRRKAAFRRANLALRAGMESPGGGPRPPQRRLFWQPSGEPSCSMPSAVCARRTGW